MTASTVVPFDWPEWVPEKIRAEVHAFWTCFGRSGAMAWREDAERQGAPAFGDLVTLHRLSDPPGVYTGRGRYVHAWNNIGRVVHDDGTYDYVSFYRDWREWQAEVAA